MASVAQAALNWQRRQAKVLQQTYTQAWAAGAANYRSQHQRLLQATPLQQATPLVPGQPPVGALSMPPVARPNPTIMSRALTPALTSLARMAAQLATIAPSAAAILAGGGLAAATTATAAEFLKANAWLLAAGVSVAWAGEQAGYAETAARDGYWLEWQLDPRADHCEDCPILATFPPMPLSQWPTLPGDGMTECSVGCKCSFLAVLAPADPDRTLTPVQQTTLARVSLRAPVTAHAY